MTMLPDITREPTVVSIKPSSSNNNIKQGHSWSANAALNNSTPTLNVISASTNNLSGTNLPETAISYNNNVNNVNNNNNNNDTNNNTDSHFPSLIFNDKKRSTAYHRLSRLNSSNGEIDSKLITSPIATNIYHNWPATQRLRASAVKAKSRVYKPSQRISEPSRPPAPYKVNTSYESVEAHFHNEKRVWEMKRWQYIREHTTWSIYPYAALDERESYK